MWCAKLLTMAAITFTGANADFDRRHSTSEMGHSLPDCAIRQMSVGHPLADMRVDIADRCFGPLATGSDLADPALLDNFSKRHLPLVVGTARSTIET